MMVSPRIAVTKWAILNPVKRTLQRAIKFELTLFVYKGVNWFILFSCLFFLAEGVMKNSIFQTSTKMDTKL